MVAIRITGCARKLFWESVVRACSKPSNYDVNVYHMNEGHAALLTVGLMELQLGGDLTRTIGERDTAGSPRPLCVYYPHPGARRT